MDHKLPKFLVIIVVVSLCLPLALKGGQKDQSKEQQSLKVSTHLVLVPVVVTNKQGEHVTGLEANDFEVKEDGSTQKIVRIDEFSADTGKIQSGSADNDPKNFTNHVYADHPKKLTIIALDQVNTPFASARDGHRMLVEFLSKHVDANTLLALVAMQHNGIRIIHNFTSDPSILVTAVRKMQAQLSSRDARVLDTLGDNSEADQEVAMLTALLSTPNASSAPNGGSSAMAAAARASIRQAQAQVDASFQAQEALITLEDFQQMAEYFGGVPGRKSLIWASTGFPFAMGTLPTSSTRGTLFDDWERTFHMLSDANISVYPVDIGGLLPGANANNIQSLNSAAIRSGAADGGTPARQGQLAAVESGELVSASFGYHETMRQLADMTGGQAYYNANDGAELFRRAADDASQYYLLAYYTRENGKNGWRKLNVKVAREGVKVRARTGFFFADSATESESARQAEETIAMSSDVNFTTMPIEGKWQQIETAGNERKVRFLLTVPAGVPFIDADNKNLLNFDFRVLVLDSKGQIAGKIGQRLQTNLATDEVQQIQKSGLDYVNELTLPPGQYKVHFVVRDNLKGTLGSVVTSLKLE